MNDVYQVDLITIQERFFFLLTLAMDKFLLTSHYYSFLLSLCPTQGHPGEVTNTHLDICPTIWIK
jgi:hypothetical protein